MKYFLPICIIGLLFSCQQAPKQEQEKPQDEWLSLWNGEDFAGWHSYLGTPYEVDEDSLGNPIEAFGIDNDPLEVFKVVATDQGNAIRVSGVAWGMVYTEASYQNYHLKLKVKWGEDMHPPRENGPRDSGLLYHSFGPVVTAYTWMDSQELQVQQGDMGDYWPVGDVEIDIPSVPFDGKYYKYKEGADLRTYYFAEILSTATADSLAKRRVRKFPDAEWPHGEWNDVELITFGDSSIHIVNGQVVMRLYNSRRMSDKQAVTSGKIQLQSEGAEVFYKDLKLKNISSIPARYKE
ncbi:MAG: DUF1080 domain-containing protein [Cyclobacteriaceae bacterium]